MKGPRIQILTEDSRVLVRVRGAELFDLVDDHLTSKIEKLLYRLPEQSGKSDTHDILCPLEMSEAFVKHLIASLPKQDRQAAETADNAAQQAVQRDGPASGGSAR